MGSGAKLGYRFASVVTYSSRIIHYFGSQIYLYKYRKTNMITTNYCTATKKLPFHIVVQCVKSLQFFVTKKN